MQRAAAGGEARLFELEKLSSIEATRLLTTEQRTRLAELDAELDGVAAEVRGQTERNQQLQSEIDALKLSRAEHAKAIELAEAERKAEEERLDQLRQVAVEKEQQGRQKAEQEEAERQARRAAAAQAEEEVRNRAKAEAERQF